MNTRQCEGKSLQDYTCQFKTSKDVMESHLGNPLISSKYIKTMEEFKEAKEEMDNKNEIQIIRENISPYNERWIKIASNQVYAYIHLENSDQDKYGAILRKRHQAPRKKWAIHEFQLTQSKGSDETECKSSTISSLKNSSNRSKKIGWANIYYNFAQGYNLKDLILLDSDSTNTIFCNKNYVYNIRQSEKPLKLHTNGGELITTQICDIPFLGTH